MKNIKNLLLISVTTIVLMLTSSQQAQATDLEIVFKDSAWGACIGAAAALATWGLTNSDEGDKIGPSMGQGAAFGLLLGIGYGIYEVNIAYNDNGIEEPVHAFANYNRNQNRMTISPFNLFSASFSPENGGLVIRSTVFHSIF